MSKTKRRKEKVTIEKLAQMSQNQFLELQEEMRHGFAKVDQRIDALEISVKDVMTDAVKEIRDNIQKLNYAREIDELRHRVTRLEEKTGLGKKAFFKRPRGV